MPWNFYTSAGALKNAEYVGSEFPAGTIVDFAGTSAPTGWLLCDGATVSRSTYSSLFNVIGTAYGAGDGSTTFKIPDATGKIIYATPGLKLAAPILPSTYVTSLPASPTDGQEVYYAADATNGVIWHLRYRSAASTYKWEFVGGTPLITRSTSIADEATHGNSSGAAFSNAMTLAAPFQGVYQVHVAFRCIIESRTSYSFGIYTFMGVRPLSQSAIITDNFTGGTLGNGVESGTQGVPQLVHYAATRATLTTQLSLEGIYGASMSSGSGVVRFRYREIGLTPVKVG